MHKYDPTEEFQLFGPKPVCGVEIKGVRAFLRESDAGNEVWRVNWELEETLERIVG
jgi:hypothetical protein